MNRESLRSLLVGSAWVVAIFGGLVGALSLVTGRSPAGDGSTRAVYRVVEEHELALWIYQPKDGKSGDRRPAVLFFFGGGFETGLPSQFAKQAEALAKGGMVAMTIDYRFWGWSGGLVTLLEPDADRDRFLAMVEQGRFAEWAEVHGNLYGTSTDQLQRAREDGKRGIVFDIDHQGARQIKARLPDAIGVFVLPPSMDELRRRLEGRATDSPEVIERRFAIARDEIAHYPSFDYLVVNDDLEEAKRCVVSVARAELVRRRRLAPLAERLLRD